MKIASQTRAILRDMNWARPSFAVIDFVAAAPLYFLSCARTFGGS
jgi:hypothetical protein